MKTKLDYKKLLLDNTYYGGSQDWYNKHLKRLSGCGPTTASTIIMYEIRKEKEDFSKEDYIDLMNMMWNYITPGRMGVNKPGIYIDGFIDYVKKHNINLTKCNAIHTDKTHRLNENDVYLFIKEALELNHPVAFLNLDNGKEKELESWHWVTIVAIDDNLTTTICDDGALKDIDLSLWINTSVSGDFIYFY